MSWVGNIRVGIVCLCVCVCGGGWDGLSEWVMSFNRPDEFDTEDITFIGPMHLNEPNITYLTR